MGSAADPFTEHRRQSRGLARRSWDTLGESPSESRRRPSASLPPRNTPSHRSPDACARALQPTIIDGMRWMVRARALGILAASLVAGLTAARLAPAAEPADSEGLDLLQVAPDQRRRLVVGEILSYPVSEFSERELAVGLAIFVQAPLGRVAEYLSSGQVIARDSTISEFGIMAEPTGTEPLPGSPLVKGERDEAGEPLDASPGTRFNLSPAQIATPPRPRDAPAPRSPPRKARKGWDPVWGVLPPG